LSRHFPCGKTVAPEESQLPAFCAGTSRAQLLVPWYCRRTIERVSRSSPFKFKALSSTSFGYSQESQTALYKRFVRPVLSYASPAWAPDLAPVHMKVMQRTQKAALRIASGCVQSTPTAHLHAETKVLPIQDHLDMRGTQLIESAKCPDHPLHHLHLSPTGRRSHLHSTPSSYYGALCASVPPLPPRRTPESWIHQHSVTRSAHLTPYSRRSPPRYLPIGGYATEEGQCSLVSLAVRTPPSPSFLRVPSPPGYRSHLSVVRGCSGGAASFYVDVQGTVWPPATVENHFSAWSLIVPGGLIGFSESCRGHPGSSITPPTPTHTHMCVAPFRGDAQGPLGGPGEAPRGYATTTPWYSLYRELWAILLCNANTTKHDGNNIVVSYTFLWEYTAEYFQINNPLKTLLFDDIYCVQHSSQMVLQTLLS